MAFPDLPKEQGTKAKSLVALRLLMLLGLAIPCVLGWSMFRDRETRLAFSQTIVPMYGEGFAMSFRLRSSGCLKSSQEGRTDDEAYGRMGSSFPFASEIYLVSLLNARRIAMKIGRYNTINSCLSHSEAPNLNTISLLGFTKEAGLVSSLREQILKEPTLRHLNIRVLDQLPNIASGGGETVVILTSQEDFSSVIGVHTDQKWRFELDALLHQRLSKNDNLTIERFAKAKQSGAIEGNFVNFGFSLWFGTESEVRPNFCQIENRRRSTTEAALISSILACLRLSAMPQTKLSVASGTIP